jgi:hypothetical protein
MKNTLFGLVNWCLFDPRRTFAVIMLIVVVVTLTLAVAPGGVAFAEDITSGS